MVILAWYLSATLSNSVNKIILTYFPYATSLTLLETLFVIFFSYMGMKSHGVGRPAHMSVAKMYWLSFPLAVGKDLGQVTTAMAIERLSISFVHTVKSTSPVFTVFLSKVWLGEEHTTEIIFSLFPIIGGVWLSTVSEVDLNPEGLMAALLSVIFFTLQNLYSKVLMTSHNVHHTVLVYYTSVVGLFLLLPFWFTVDVGGILVMRMTCTVLPVSLFPQCAEKYSVQLLIEHNGEGISEVRLLVLYLLAAVFHYVQVIMAIKVLEKASVVTYSVANTFKRVFVIVASVLYFQNTVTFLNSLGIIISVAGIVWYNEARRRVKYPSSRKESKEIIGVPKEGSTYPKEGFSLNGSSLNV